MQHDFSPLLCSLNRETTERFEKACNGPLKSSGDVIRSLHAKSAISRFAACFVTIPTQNKADLTVATEHPALAADEINPSASVLVANRP